MMRIRNLKCTFLNVINFNKKDPKNIEIGFFKDEISISKYKGFLYFDILTKIKKNVEKMSIIGNFNCVHPVLHCLYSNIEI